MTEALIVILITSFVFLALIVNMARNHQNTSSSSLTGIAAIMASLGGLILYGLAYNELKDNEVIAMVSSLEATICMFLGKNEYENIKDAYIMQKDISVILFWIVHLLALYATTNAVLATIGSSALKHLRVWTRKFRKNIVIIYGVNTHSMSLCADLSTDKNNSVLFVDKGISHEHITMLKESGTLYYVTEEALNSEISFLKRIGINKSKQISVYVIGESENENFDYAVKLRDSLGKMGISSQNTSLTLIANMEMRYGEILQAYKNVYGYGSVMVLDGAYLSAHTLVNEYPPCNYIEFDLDSCKAKEGQMFHAVIIGFGKIGQSVLKNLVINGQFEGARFKVSVFDPKYEQVAGNIFCNNRSMLEKYDIVFNPVSAKEPAFYEYLEQNVSEIDYVVVCTGDCNMNSEIAAEIQGGLKHLNNHADVFQCSYDSIIHLKEATDEAVASLQITELYTSKNMDTKKADRMAMFINHAYCSGESPESDWNHADFIDRMSCRASADFALNYLKISGLGSQEVINGGLNRLSERQLTNLSKTEHLRWCAFHYSLGYTQMTAEVFDERVRKYTEQIKKHGKSSIRIQKDAVRYMHICLVDWEELDELSEKYKNITGDTSKDYKREDTSNILMLGEILKKMEK